MDFRHPRLPRALGAVLASWLVAGCTSTPAGVSAERRDPASLRVLSYNIKHGHGMDGRVDLERIARVIEGAAADVVLLQEVDQGCARSGSVDQAAWLGARLGLAYVFCAFRDYDGGRYGMAALSRLPISGSVSLALPPGPNPLRCLELQLDLHGRPITVTGLHLVQTEEQRLAQALFLIERYSGSGIPAVLAGDLNSERGDAVLAAFQSAFDVHRSAGEALTFPADAPVKEIDFVLSGPRGGWGFVQGSVIPESIASDHRPVCVTLRLPGG